MWSSRSSLATKVCFWIMVELYAVVLLEILCAAFAAAAAPRLPALRIDPASITTSGISSGAGRSPSPVAIPLSLSSFPTRPLIAAPALPSSAHRFRRAISRCL
jgi:hypothetical protein